MDASGGRSLSTQQQQQKTRYHSQHTPLTLREVKDQLEAAVQDRDDIIKPIRTILKGLKEDGDSSIRKEIFVFSVDQLNGDELVNSKAKELIGLLLVEVDKLEGSVLIELSQLFINGVKDGSVSNGRSLELFPKILSTIMNQASITGQEQGGSNTNTMSGHDWKRHLLNSFLSCKWCDTSVLPVVNVSRDSPLEPDELQLLVEKLLRVMKTLPAQELPPLVYQLLLLAKKGHQSLILTGIKNLFNQETETNTEDENGEIDLMEVGTSYKELLSSEGTALLHVDFALRQDQVLSKEFWKLMKVSPSSFHPSNYTPFTLSIALSQSLILRLEDTIMDNMKGIILRCLKERDMISSSHWMLELSQYRPIPDIEEMFLRIVDYSVNGWDLVIQGLINMSFSIFDTLSPKNTNAAFQKTPQNKACVLGGNILIKAFKSQSIVRSEVITQLTNRILTSSTVYAGHYISILAELTRLSPQVLIDVAPQLKEVFDYIMYIPSTAAVPLIKAILPLVQFRSSYRDYLLITIRKSLFSREVEARCAAVGSSLVLVKNFKVLESTTSEDEFAYSSQSQTLVEVHTSNAGSRTSNESICIEILGMLRRSLTHQETVRLTLYEALPSTFSSNIKLSNHILDLLLDHFTTHYYEPDDDLLPPVKLSCCLVKNESNDTYVKREPLPHLVNCIQLCTKQCMEWSDQGVEQVSHLERLKSIMSSLSRRISSSGLDDFELDQSGDYSMTTSIGSKNHLTASMILELYEVVLDYTISTSNITEEYSKLCLDIFIKYQSVVEVLADKGGAPGKKGSYRKRLLSSSSLLLILKSLYKDTIPAHQVPLSLLRDSTPFVQYILSAILINIKMSSERVNPWSWGTTHSSISSVKNYQLLLSIGKILYDQLERPSIQTKTGRKKDKGKSVSSLCLECFWEICNVIVTCYKEQLVSFARDITNGGEGGSGDGNEHLHIVIRHFQHLVSTVLSSGGAAKGARGDYTIKDVNFMILVISSLSDHLDRTSTQCSQVLGWLDDLCRQNEIEDATLTKSLLSFLLSLHHRTKTGIKILCKVAQDIHFAIGDIEADIELSGTKCYSIINSETVSGPVLAVYQPHIELILNNIDNILNVIKSDLKEISNDDDDSTSFDSIESILGLLCDRYTRVILIMSELTQSALVPGPHTDTLTKNMAKFFSILSETVKQQSVLYSKTASLLPQFIKTVESVGANLTQKVYLFLTYLQRAQQENIEQTYSKKGKGKLMGKAQVKREKKNIPNLIYWVEEYEKQLIQLGKKSKHKFMDSYKRSVARDFKIKESTLNALMQEQEEEDIEEEEDGQASDSARPAPKAKRLKRGS